MRMRLQDTERRPGATFDGRRYELQTPACAFFSFAHRFRCAAAVRALDSELKVRLMLPVRAGGVVLVIHFGGRPRRFPCPLAMRSRTRIACSTVSRSAFNSSNIFAMFIAP
jgi:hypothetical protein